MSRGKYGARAALRRESAEVTTTIEDYKRAVAKLTEERNLLRDELAKERADRSKERRELRGMLSEGLAPELKARDRLIEDLRSRLGYQKSFDIGLKDANTRLWRLLRVALAEQGITGAAVVLWTNRHDPHFHPSVRDGEEKLLEAKMTVSSMGEPS